MSDKLFGRQPAGYLVFTAIIISGVLICQYSGCENKTSSPTQSPSKISNQPVLQIKSSTPTPALQPPQVQKEFSDQLESWMAEYKSIISKVHETGNWIPVSEYEKKFKSYKAKLRQPGIKVSNWVCSVDEIDDSRQIFCMQDSVLYHLSAGGPQKLFSELAVSDPILFSGQIVGHIKDLKALSDGVPSDTLGYYINPFGELDQMFGSNWVLPRDTDDFHKFEVKIRSVTRYKNEK